MNAVKKKTTTTCNQKTHQVVATPQLSLRGGTAIGKRSMVTSPGQAPLIGQKNQIDGGEKSHMAAALVFISLHCLHCSARNPSR